MLLTGCGSSSSQPSQVNGTDISLTRPNLRAPSSNDIKTSPRFLANYIPYHHLGVYFTRCKLQSCLLDVLVVETELTAAHSLSTISLQVLKYESKHVYGEI